MAKKYLNYRFIFPALLFIYIAFLLFWKLGDNYLTNWDEAWYADIARNLAMDGDPRKLIWNHGPFFDKPPLYIWLEAIAFNLFGEGEFVARLPSAISGMGAFVILYMLAGTCFNKKIALLSLIVFGSTIGFLYRARTGNLDTLLTSWLLFSIMVFYKAYKHRSSRWFMFMGLSTGLAFLTKGMIAFIFPLLGIVFLLVRKDYFLAKSVFIYTITPAASISLLWVFASYTVNGEAFLRLFLLNQAEKVAPGILFWKNFSLEYLWFLKSGLKIWFIPFVLVFPYVLNRWKKDERVILAVYFLLGIGILSFSENKSNWFLLPFYPIVALMIADGIYGVVEKFTHGKLRLVFFGGVFVLACLQNFIYKNDYIVSDIAGDEARVALAAKQFTKESDILYLTNYYYPTTVYYSERKVYAVYSEHEKNPSWWIKSKTQWESILEQEPVYIITTKEERGDLQKYFQKHTFKTLYQSGQKLLIKKES